MSNNYDTNTPPHLRAEEISRLCDAIVTTTFDAIDDASKEVIARLMYQTVMELMTEVVNEETWGKVIGDYGWVEMESIYTVLSINNCCVPRKLVEQLRP